jgi:hypothetical protein
VRWSGTNKSNTKQQFRTRDLENPEDIYTYDPGLKINLKEKKTFTLSLYDMIRFSITTINFRMNANEA